MMSLIMKPLHLLVPQDNQTIQDYYQPAYLKIKLKIHQNILLEVVTDRFSINLRYGCDVNCLKSIISQQTKNGDCYNLR